MKNTAERRRYFRIDDVVGLDYRVLEPEESYPSDAEDQANSVFRMLFDELDLALNRAVNTAWETDENIAQALGLLNKKLDLIAEQCPQDVVPAQATLQEKDVNLSGSGIAFSCSQEHDTGSRLGLAILLKPANTYVRFTARVVSCESIQEVPNEMFLLRLAIEENNTAAQEQLIQHVAQKQYAAIDDKESLRR